MRPVSGKTGSKRRWRHAGLGRFQSEKGEMSERRGGE